LLFDSRFASVRVFLCKGKERRDPIPNSVQRQTDISVEDVASLWTYEIASKADVHL